MNEKTKKSMYVLADLGWRSSILLGKVALFFGLAAIIPSLALDISEKRERRARTNK